MEESGQIKVIWEIDSKALLSGAKGEQVLNDMLMII